MFSRYVGLYGEITKFIQYYSANEFLINLIGFANGFVEGVVFLNLYYPGTVFIVFTYSIVVDQGYNKLFYVLSTTMGVSSGLIVSSIMGTRISSNLPQGGLIENAIKAFDRYGAYWIVLASWSPNWISTTICAVSYLKGKIVTKYIVVGSFTSFVFYSIYAFFFSKFYKFIPVNEDNHQYYVAGLIFAIGIGIEWFNHRQRMQRK